MQQLREENLPSDSKFLFNIDKITIDIEDEHLPFCYCYYSDIKLGNNKYICDKFFIITSSFQINMFIKCTQIFLMQFSKVAQNLCINYLIFPDISEILMD